jgi:NAD(P)-dependent dehydrogenase (short-subunit alcohol dehydrogenase family)
VKPAGRSDLAVAVDRDARMSDLSGRVAVVTGAGRGLGRGVALAFAEHGAQVAAVARSADQLRDTVERAGVSRGDRAAGRIVAFPTDVGNIDAVDRLKADVEAQLGKPAILVSAAGVFGPIQLIRDSDPRAWIETIMIDAVAPYLLAHAFVGGMLDAGWGRIVNVTSAASLHTPGPLNSAYATAKVALNQFTRHLAAEIAGSGVTANVIHPGDVKTDMWKDISDRVSAMGPEADAYRQWAKWVAETGGDPPEKAVRLVLRLVSDEGAAINGRFNWIDDPLQAPIPSWGEDLVLQPWRE